MKKALVMRMRLWAPVIVWMTVIFTLSSIPGKDIPHIKLPHLDKLIHLIEYSVLGFLLIRAFLNSGTGINRVFLAAFSVFIAVGFAVTDEWHQSFIPDRITDIIDFMFDSIGSAIGVFVYRTTRNTAKTRNGSQIASFAKAQNKDRR